MIDFQTGLQNIVAGQGVPIAIAGMAIVFTVLGLTATFIHVLPHVLRWLAAYVPEPALPAARLNGEDDTALAAVAAAAYHAARGEKA